MQGGLRPIRTSGAVVKMIYAYLYMRIYIEFEHIYECKIC
jgi:hypothetical protein